MYTYFTEKVAKQINKFTQVNYDQKAVFIYLFIPGPWSNLYIQLFNTIYE